MIHGILRVRRDGMRRRSKRRSHDECHFQTIRFAGELCIRERIRRIGDARRTKSGISLPCWIEATVSTRLDVTKEVEHE